MSAPPPIWKDREAEFEDFADAATELDARRLLSGVALLIAALVLGLLVGSPGIAGTDRSVLGGMLAMRTPGLTTAMLVVTNAFSPTNAIALSLLIGILGLGLGGSRRESVFVPGAMLLSAAITSVVKLAIGRIRPEMPDRLVVELSHSYPSGHTTAAASVAAAGAILVLANLRRRAEAAGDTERFLLQPGRGTAALVVAGAALLTALIAFTRVYLAAHWLSDVVGGALVGGATSLILAELFFRDV